MYTALASLFVTASCSNDDMTHEKEQKSITIENLVSPKTYVQSGTFMGAGTPPIIMPGQSVSIRFNAAKPQRLMLATMYGKSADWFFAPDQGGIRLYNDRGEAITGDVSDQLKLWDNGTKADKEHAEDKAIMQVEGLMAKDFVRLMLQYDEAKSEFTLTIHNVSKGDMETPLSPGVWAVSNYDGKMLLEPMPFFTPGQKSNPEITAIAQGGDISMLQKKVEEATGIITGLSPVLAVVYEGMDNPIFKVGMKEKGNGLKELAQSGNTEKLMMYLKKMEGVKHVFVVGNAPIAPGQKAMATYQAAKGCKIALVTMFGFSNDWFYANNTELSAVDNADLTSHITLYDAGTAMSQYPGAGAHQPLFMGMPMMEDKVIMEVGNMYPVPMTKDVLRITIH